MNDLTFFTNEKGKTLTNRFCKILNSNTQYFDMLVGYFRASGFHQLYEALEKVDKIRVIIGINTDESIIKANDIARNTDGKLYLAPKEIKNLTKKSIKSEMEDSEDKYEVEKGVKKLIEFIRKGKIEIRVYPNEKIHAKVYIVRKNLEFSDDYGKVITGSSNFSYSGLQGNLEFNVELKNSGDVKFALEKFEKIWNESEELTSDYADVLEKDTWIREDITPYELYLKFLFEYFAEEMNEDKIKKEIEDLPNGFIKYRYQMDAVNQAERILKKYNGVFLADVVGLGKTFITALLARELYGHKLVVCPPVLKEYWGKVLMDFGVQAKVISLGKLDEILEKYDNNYFKYIFIDEAHRFRNSNTEAYTKLHQICVNKKVILISATPQNNSPLDLFNLISLFQYKNDSNIIEDQPDLENFFNKLISREKKAKKIVKNNNSETNIKKLNDVIKKNSSEIREKVLKKIMVRRLRNEIKKYYKEDIEKQGLVFPVVGSPEQIIYTFDDKTDEIFEDILKSISKINYSRYKALVYLTNPDNQEKSLQAGQLNLQGFMKALMIKRLESSFFAFSNTIRRFKESYEKFINMYKNGVIYISKKYNVYDLLEQEDDEKLLELVNENEIEKYNTSEFNEKFIKDLEEDLKILEKMYKNIKNIGIDCKLEYFLKELQENKILKENKIIIFTESQETAEYLSENIIKRLNKKVIHYTGASSSNQKRIIEINFDPNSNRKEDNYNILITTDVLAEGINLHRASVLINYDLPWNPTRIMQRIGRINRVGTKFDRIYVFNFFPTNKSSEHLSLKDNIMNKIQSFHNTLGEDFKYLSEDEEIDSFGLYSKLTKSFDEEEDGETELEYLQLIRKIRDDDEELFFKVRDLPKKSKSGKNYKSSKTSVISFLKKGDIKKIYITDSQLNTKEIFFYEAVKFLKCEKTEKKVEINSDFFELLAINKAQFKNDTQIQVVKNRKVGINKELKIIIKALENYKKFNEYEIEKLEKISEIMKVGKLPKKQIKIINEECKKIIKNQNPHEVLDVFYENIPEEYKGITKKNKNYTNDKLEVLLSEYLAGDEKWKIKN
ncbi:MAG: helicase-related protein [Fusobacterium sp.]